MLTYVLTLNIVIVMGLVAPLLGPGCTVTAGIAFCVCSKYFLAADYGRQSKGARGRSPSKVVKRDE